MVTERFRDWLDVYHAARLAGMSRVQAADYADAQAPQFTETTASHKEFDNAQHVS
jgi:hypothetical protein